MKKLMLIALLFISGQSIGQNALGEVIGTVVTPESKIPVVDALVYIEDNGRIYRSKTDLDGRFRISAIPSGAYSMSIRQFEDTMRNILVEVPIDGFFNTGEIEFNSSILTMKGVVVKVKLRLVDGNLPVAALSADQIDKSPAKFDIKGLVTSMSSEVRQTEDGELVFRGARKGDMIYLIDGVKTRDAGSVPGVSIGKMMLYTGGLPAKYGDTLGGVVVMESKSYFDLYRRWEASQLH